MNIDNFLAHHRIAENPFAAEEARLDPVFERLLDDSPTHSDFAKILGPIEQPTTSVVFGEKGSGKTALRLQMARQISRHNEHNPDKKILVVTYDDLNPMLDNLLRHGRRDQAVVLEQIRIEDHQDAILALAITQLVSGLLGESDQGDDAITLPPQPFKRIAKRMSAQQRADFAVLGGLYDQPASGNVMARWQKLRRKLRLGWLLPGVVIYSVAAILSITTGGLGVAWQFPPVTATEPLWLLPALGLSAAGAIALWGYWAYQNLACWRLCRRLVKQMPAINRNPGELWRMFRQVGGDDLSRQPWPLPESVGANPRDSRYQLTRRLIDLLGVLDYCGLMVLIDRIDEPTLVSGNVQSMKAVLWPMLDNKFLKQDRIGLKMLLPIELRAILHRESAEFFQAARLDKQHLIDRLSWSGVMLYDLCTRRLQACGVGNTPDPSENPDPPSPASQSHTQISLTDLFETNVSRDLLIDALNQMHQPRDAFKLLYELIQEHCRITPDEQPDYRIARLTLDAVRRNQAQRVQDLQRGLTPG